MPECGANAMGRTVCLVAADEFDPGEGRQSTGDQQQREQVDRYVRGGESGRRLG